MQQTEKYQLNLIETSDTFSPAALNENAQKIEAALGAAGAALSAETNARAAETNARAAGDAALDSRVTVLEADKVKMIVGSYTGTGGAYGNTQTISLGVTPKAVFILSPVRNYYSLDLITQALPIFDSAMGCGRNVAEIVEGGFMVTRDSHTAFNNPGEICHFVALV